MSGLYLFYVSPSRHTPNRFLISVTLPTKNLLPLAIWPHVVMPDNTDEETAPQEYEDDHTTDHGESKNCRPSFDWIVDDVDEKVRFRA